MDELFYVPRSGKNALLRDRIRFELMQGKTTLLVCASTPNVKFWEEGLTIDEADLLKYHVDGKVLEPPDE